MANFLSKRSTAAGLGVASAVGLVAASILGVSTAAQADYVSPDSLTYEGESSVGWNHWNESHDDGVAELTQCSIIINPDSALWYRFSDEEAPSTAEELQAFIESFSANITTGSANFDVLTDYDSAGESSTTGIADFSVTFPAGEAQLTLQMTVSFDASSELELPESGELSLLIDALEGLTIDTFEFGLWVSHEATESAELQWVQFNGETYWFGTDAEWYLNDPSCGLGGDDDEDTDPPAPTAPDRVETARLG